MLAQSTCYYGAEDNQALSCLLLSLARLRCNQETLLGQSVYSTIDLERFALTVILQRTIIEGIVAAKVIAQVLVQLCISPVELLQRH
jgi:hypothetical protein